MSHGVHKTGVVGALIGGAWKQPPAPFARPPYRQPPPTLRRVAPAKPYPLPRARRRREAKRRRGRRTGAAAGCIAFGGPSGGEGGAPLALLVLGAGRLSHEESGSIRLFAT